MRATKDVELPRRARIGDCGYDFFLPEDTIFLDRGKGILEATVDTGIIMEEGDIPPGHAMFLFPRSSTGTNYGLQLKNSTGVIDAGYRGTIRATMIVVDPTVGILRLCKGDRFMQGVILPFATIAGEVPPEGERGTGGYGSTGL